MRLANPVPYTRLTTTAESDCSSPSLEERIPARQVAKILGVKVATLSKWSYLGKGPRGWLRVSATCVVEKAGVRKAIAAAKGMAE